MPPLEVFVLRIALMESERDQAVHGVMEVVRNERHCTFSSFDGLIHLLRRELESARNQARPGEIR